MKNDATIRYPRRQILRWVLKKLTQFLIFGLCRLKVEGVENIPKTGPIIIAPNHFHFADPPLMIATIPRHLEFVGGAVRINSPRWTDAFPRLWGIIYAFRGGNSNSTLKLSQSVLEQGGVMCIFIEGSSNAAVLRPARPGTAMLAHVSDTPIIPVTIINANGLFKAWRPTLEIVFHPPITSPEHTETGRNRRRILDQFSDEIMAVIATRLPEAQKGRFSTCPDARAAAEAVSEFEFNTPELRGK